MKTCKTEDCDRPVKAIGLCIRHYQQDLRANPRPKRPKYTHCTIQGCDKPVMAKGFCSTHYQLDRNRRKRGESGLEQGNSGLCSRCGKVADKLHLSRCRVQPKIKPGDGDPRHGTSVGRSHHRCSCELCAEFGRYAARLHRRRKGVKERILVSSAYAQQHLRWLMRTYPAYAIGKAIGRSKRSTLSILSRRTIDKRLSDAILALTISDVMPHVGPSSLLPIKPYVRIGEELLAAGWTKLGIEKQVGYVGGNMTIFRDNPQRIQARNARALQRIHDEAWRNNTNNFRRYCTCIKVAEPEITRNTDAQRALRQRRSA